MFSPEGRTTELELCFAPQDVHDSWELAAETRHESATAAEWQDGNREVTTNTTAIAEKDDKVSINKWKITIRKKIGNKPQV